MTKIEWTNKTWNPTTGCNKVSDGCKNCYAEKMHKRQMALNPQKYAHPFLDGAFPYEPDLDKPLHWRKPAMIFVNSMSDLFHENVPYSFLDKVFAIMHKAKHHTFQILTKRPENALKYILTAMHDEECRYEGFYDELNKLGIPDETPMPPNIWLGTSVENQATADERIPSLLQIPVAVRFLSCEPLLGEVDLSRWITVNEPQQSWFYAKCNSCGYVGSSEYFEGGYPMADTGDYSEIECPKCGSSAIDDNVDDLIHWVITGGESGTGSRPMHPEWPRKLRDQCVSAGAPFFFKQWGDYILPDQMTLEQIELNKEPHKQWIGERLCEIYKLGKKHTGRLLDGRTWDEFPNSEIVRGEIVK